MTWCRLTITVDDDFSDGFGLTHWIRRRADVASGVRKGDPAELHRDNTKNKFIKKKNIQIWC